jgi:hypothetical protein
MGLAFKIEDLRDCTTPLRLLTKCRVCEKNNITRRVKNINICDSLTCYGTSQIYSFSYPDPEFKITNN